MIAGQEWPAMADNQQDIDALLAEVNALADEAVADIVGDEAAGPGDAAIDGAGSVGPAAEPAGALAQPAPAPEQTPSGPQAIKASPGEDPSRILNLQVPVIVQLAERTMALTTIVNLNTGAILEFDKPSDSELDLMINNKCIGQGHAVKVGENFGLRVNNIGSVHQRIEALGNN